MVMTWGRMLVLGMVSLYLFVTGFACGVASERIQFDRQRTKALHRYDEAVRQWRQFLMVAERRAQARPVGGAPGDE